MTSQTLNSLSPVQAQVVLSLSSGASLSAAARSAGCSRTTIYNWMHDTASGFARQVELARAEFTLALSDELREASLKALRTLTAILDSPKASDSIRLKAALALLNRPNTADHSWALPEAVYPAGVRRAESILAEAEEQANSQPQPAAGTERNTSEQPAQSVKPSPVKPPSTITDIVNDVKQQWAKAQQDAQSRFLARHNGSLPAGGFAK